MLKLKSNGKWMKKLISLPESGMGYQVADITLKDGRIIKRLTVWNCKDVFLPPGYEKVCEKDISDIQISN